MNEKILELLQSMNDRFNSFEEQMKDFGSKINSIEEKMNHLSYQVDRVEKKLDGIGYQFEEVTSHRIEKEENIEKTLDALKIKIMNLEINELRKN